MRQSLSLGIIVAGLLFLSGCSSLPASLGGGTTSTTASNPGGAAIPTLATATVLEVSVPPHSTVAANCAAGDVNSCTEMTNITNFCKATTAIQEPFKACVSAGWPTS